MPIFEMKAPSPGKSISEVKIVTWLVIDGDYVQKDQIIAEFDSDKATLELSAKKTGIITLKVEEGDIVAVGDVCCLINTDKKPPNGVKKQAPSKRENVSMDKVNTDKSDDLNSLKSQKDNSPNINGQHVIEFPFDHDDYPGLIFSGEFKCGKLHGYGSVSMSEEYVETTVISGNYEQEGDFIDNELNGIGKMLDYEDQIEFGHFKNGNLDGIGWINDADYNFTKARFENGKLIEIIKECDIINKDSKCNAMSIFHGIDLDDIRIKIKT